MAHLLVSAHQSALAHPAIATQHWPTEGLPPSSGHPSCHRPSGHAVASHATDGRPPALRWNRTEAPPGLLHSPALARRPSTPSPFYSSKQAGIESPPLSATRLPGATSPCLPDPIKGTPTLVATSTTHSCCLHFFSAPPSAAPLSSSHHRHPSPPPA
jgi:hypothetical protein